MADHAEFAALALELITEEGRQVTLNELSGTAVDNAKPWNGPAQQDAVNPVLTFAVFLPAHGADLGTVVTDKELLAKVDMVALVPPGVTDLRNMKQMIDGSRTLKVEWIQVLQPADTVCLYVFGVCE